MSTAEPGSQFCEDVPQKRSSFSCYAAKEDHVWAAEAEQFSKSVFEPGGLGCNAGFRMPTGTILGRSGVAICRNDVGGKVRDERQR